MFRANKGIPIQLLAIMNKKKAKGYVRKPLGEAQMWWENFWLRLARG